MAKTRRKANNDPLIQDIAGVASATLGAVLLVGLVAHSSSGWFGEQVSGVLTLIAGLGAYVIPFLLMFAGYTLVTGVRHSATSNRIIGFVLLFVVFTSWCQFARTDSVVGLAHGAPGYEEANLGIEVRHGGGMVGLGASYILEAIFGRISSYIILTATAITGSLLISGASLVAIIESTGRLFAPRGRRRAKAVRGLEDESATDVEAKSRIRTRKDTSEVLSVLKKRIFSHDQEKADVRPGVVIARVSEDAQKPKSVGVAPPLPKSGSEYQLPPITLLKEPPPPPKRVQADLNYKIDVIERTLEEFKIEANVVEVSHGPTVTRYEIQLAPGIKVSKIVSLADNLAMSLAAIDVRVEAPIPGKSAIGVEVPNSNPAIVTLRECLDTDEFRGAPSKLTIALGKDVAGEPRYADLTKMPHMLVAGATNAGKSVCLNTLIASLLFRATPREVKMILIDPKRVELSLYDGIPHLCAPVVRDVRQATGILRAALKEMERRYDLFVEKQTRDFNGYNEKVKPEERLPYIVIIVDELADLMMQAGPEVEFSICRLAQLARATGIHLVIATQRPSVDVVTGTIKANISSRIAFAMNSQVDSRTILDMSGAERLIGRGDMLFKPIDAAKPTRIQGCFISEKEIEALVKFIKDQESPDYTMEPVQVGEVGSSDALNDAVNDEVYEPAVRMVVMNGYASTSIIQRKFRIGYTRAARLVDAMEQQGIVGPPDGAKPREVLITKDDLDRLFGGSSFSGQGNYQSEDE